MGSEGKNNESLFLQIKCVSRGGTEGHLEDLTKMSQPLNEVPEGPQGRQRRSTPRGLGSSCSQGCRPHSGCSQYPEGHLSRF